VIFDWSFDQPVLGFDTVWSGWDDPNAENPLIAELSQIDAISANRGRLTFTIEYELLCAVVEAIPSLLLPVESENTLRVETESTSTMILEVETEGCL